MKRAGLLAAVVLLAGAPFAGEAQNTTSANNGSGAQSFIPGAGPPESSGTFDKGPDWIRRPLASEIQSVFPGAAMRAGEDGDVRLQCTVTVDGGLRGCKVLSEAPTGFGFGNAGLALARQFTFRPATKDGKSVESMVTIPITFIGPDVPTGSIIRGVNTLGLQKVVQNPVWKVAPSYADVLAAYPAAAKAQKKGGRVTLSCTFTADGGLKGCGILSEEPQGLGFGEAARALTGQFKVEPKLSDGQSIGDLGVQVPFTFSDRMLANNRPALGQPDWVSLPSNEAFGAAFPAKAKAAGVLSSQVSLLCVVGEGGVLGGCRSMAETPAGYGFGEAAVSVSSGFVVSPWSEDGLPTIGAQVRVPVRYEMKTAAAAQPARP